MDVPPLALKPPSPTSVPACRPRSWKNLLPTTAPPPVPRRPFDSFRKWIAIRWDESGVEWYSFRSGALERIQTFYATFYVLSSNAKEMRTIYIIGIDNDPDGCYITDAF